MGSAAARPDASNPVGRASWRLGWELTVLLVVASWRWGGCRNADAPFFTALAAVILVEAFGVLNRSGAIRTTGENPGWWRRDLFFWSGLVFIAYLGCQWWNAGRELGYDEQARRWAYAPPPHPGYPWAIARTDAAQMIHWFFPAWTIGLSIRSPTMSRRGFNWLARSLLFSAGTLVVAGLIELLSGVPGRFWRMPPGCDSFASFGYGNHAAAYFVMLGALAAGMFFRTSFRRDRPESKSVAGGLAAALILCLIGANLSLSRTGIIMAWSLAATAAGYGFVRSRRVLRPAARFRWAAATAAAGILLYFAVIGSRGPAISAEFTVKRHPLAQLIPAWQTVNLDLSDRPRLWGAAWRLFRAYPWYGCGGRGFAYLAAFHLPETAWRSLRTNPGRANVHCDPLQFLAEFGLAGTGLMTLALGALLVPLLRPSGRRGAVFIFGALGLALVAAFSLIDLPFRCPAILWTWTALLAALPRLTPGEPGAFRDGGFHPSKSDPLNRQQDPQP